MRLPKRLRCPAYANSPRGGPRPLTHRSHSPVVALVLSIACRIESTVKLLEPGCFHYPCKSTTPAFVTALSVSIPGQIEIAAVLIQPGCFQYPSITTERALWAAVALSISCQIESTAVLVQSGCFRYPWVSKAPSCLGPSASLRNHPCRCVDATVLLSIPDLPAYPGPTENFPSQPGAAVSRGRACWTVPLCLGSRDAFNTRPGLPLYINTQPVRRAFHLRPDRTHPRFPGPGLFRYPADSTAVLI